MLFGEDLISYGRLDVFIYRRARNKERKYNEKIGYGVIDFGIAFCGKKVEIVVYIDEREVRV